MVVVLGRSGLAFHEGASPGERAVNCDACCDSVLHAIEVTNTQPAPVPPAATKPQRAATILPPITPETWTVGLPVPAEMRGRGYARAGERDEVWAAWDSQTASDKRAMAADLDHENEPLDERIAACGGRAFPQRSRATRVESGGE